MKQYIVSWVGNGDQLNVSELKAGKDRMVYKPKATVFIIHAYSELSAVLKAKEIETKTYQADDISDTCLK